MSSKFERRVLHVAPDVPEKADGNQHHRAERLHVHSYLYILDGSARVIIRLSSSTTSDQQDLGRNSNLICRRVVSAISVS